jgi:hypothetical protein
MFLGKRRKRKKALQTQAHNILYITATPDPHLWGPSLPAIHTRPHSRHGHSFPPAQLIAGLLARRLSSALPPPSCHPNTSNSSLDEATRGRRAQLTAPLAPCLPSTYIPGRGPQSSSLRHGQCLSGDSTSTPSTRHPHTHYVPNARLPCSAKGHRWRCPAKAQLLKHLCSKHADKKSTLIHPRLHRRFLLSHLWRTPLQQRPQPHLPALAAEIAHLPIASTTPLDPGPLAAPQDQAARASPLGDTQSMQHTQSQFALLQLLWPLQPVRPAQYTKQATQPPRQPEHGEQPW